MKTALIVGITGQDGSYLTEFLLKKGYEVYGTTRSLHGSSSHFVRLLDVLSDITLIQADLTEEGSIAAAVRDAMPDEVYNLGAQSSVASSWKNSVMTAETTAVGTVRLLEAVRSYAPDARYYQASSSEMFGRSPPPQDEKTMFHPRTPYGVSKVFAYWTAVNFRESYQMFAANGILFNHESPRRGLEYLTRKVSDGVAQIVFGKADSLQLGNLDTVRDWGFAGDYVRAMWLMLQADAPDDFVIATGKAHSVRDFVERAFARVDLDYQDYVISDPALFRPYEVHSLLGDPRKIKSCLGWEPEVSFDELVAMMVDADLKRYGPL
ncbi:MAG: GDP-mannose 4,6-dehydratase [Methanomicrobiales archaeon]|jgi:GDPmannose 4,6-dehydratase|nr:GDP-mannose 4,6-dehydratase [Methanomicrobiales archaeon]